MPSVNWHAEAVIANNNANKTNRAFKLRSLEDMLPPGVDASHGSLTHQTSERFHGCWKIQPMELIRPTPDSLSA